MKFPGKSLVWLSLALLVACSTPTQRMDGTGDDEPIVTKSPNDAREYRYLTLDNGLKVLLISDEEADKAAASLSVFRGNFDDPADRPGLAHFLEHMLFIGTEKYPEPDGYFSFIEANGGSSNAYTSTDHTNYFFDIRPEAFREGLDRFAQFFIAPLFSKEYVEREKNAVHSEYQLQLKDDGWRSFVTQKVALNQDHPMSQFNIGTLDTLAGDVHGDLLSFFENNYSANQMGLVVLTNEPLDTLEPWVSEMFAPIENRNLDEIRIKAPLFRKGQLPATLVHDNIKDEYRVSYSFPIPAVRPYYDRKPANYISNLVGHEGEGSLHKLLNAKGWIKSLTANQADVDAKSSVLDITIELTQDGSDHVPEITGYLFDYLDMLRRESPKQWIYEEQARVADLGFRFKEKTSAMGTVYTLAPALEHFPPEDILVAPYLMEQFDAPLINRYLSSLKRDNVLVTISRPGFEGTLTEKWFEVSYDLKRGPVQMAAVDQAELTLPSPNPFLPNDLSIEPDDTLAPAPAVSSQAVTVFLDTDTEFGVPRTVMHISLQNDGGLISLRDVAHAKLYANLVRDDLNALAYPAYLAGVMHELATPPRGFRVSIGGYHDKQLVLLEEILLRLKNLEIRQDRFDVLKAELIRDLENVAKRRPFQQGLKRLEDELINAYWIPAAMIDVVKDMTLSDLVNWRDQTLADISLQALVHGNATTERVDDLVDVVSGYFDVGTVKVGEPSVAAVTEPRTVTLDIDHNDAMMVLYVQDDEDGFAAQAKSTLLAHLLSPGYFASLRTDQQLGYIVGMDSKVRRERGGIQFIVQSPVAPPEVLVERTHEFVESRAVWLAEMPDEEFEANKNGLIAKLTQKDKNLWSRSQRYWSDLDRRIYSFDSKLQLAEEVAALDRQDVLAVLAALDQKLDEAYLLIRSKGRFR